MNLRTSASPLDATTLEKPVNRQQFPSSKPPKGEDDVQLIERAKQGDSKAFRILFDRYQSRAFAVAFGVVRDKQEASDLVQEAFVRVFKHLPNFAGTSSFYTWFYRILMNLAIDHLRKRKPWKQTDYSDALDHESDNAHPSVASAPSEGPASHVDTQELSEHIQAALSQIPEHHRAVILLREVEGLSYAEMAEVLGIPKGTIMSRLFHARRKLQTLLTPYLQERPSDGGQS